MLCSLLDRQVFVKSPRSGVAVHGASYYTNRDEPWLVSSHAYESRSDTCDVAFLRYSRDNGRSWQYQREWAAEFQAEGGTGRRHLRGFYTDPLSGRCLIFWTEGVLPSDDPLEGLRQWKVHYGVLAPDGRSLLHTEQIVHDGTTYSERHPLPGVTIGRNCVMMGDLGERPLTRSDGTILLPVQSSPTGRDGYYANPGKGFTYTDALLLMGRWREDGRLAWTASERIVGDPERSTRGMIEPTLAELPDGRLLVVMRGSNDAEPELPGYRWYALSHDGGATWSEPAPWRYHDGQSFFSPSSCSQLLPWRDGRLFWVGNLCGENPRGNSPRYPLVLAEVDPRSGMLVRGSVSILDDRRSDESPRLTLSNFYVREDRESGHLLLHMTRLFANQQPDAPTDWTADAMQYRYVIS